MTLQRGWFLDKDKAGRRKWHYFNRRHRSVCWAQEFDSGAPPDKGLVDSDDDNPNRCATCRTKVSRMRQREAKLRSRMVANTYVGSNDITDLVKADLERRSQLGELKYGKRLTVDQPCHNGQSALHNAYEEALDLACYLKKAINEGR